jgi:outer membrane protein assembly factor BamD
LKTQRAVTNRAIQKIVVAVLLGVMAGCGAKNKVADQLAPDVLFEKALAELHKRHWAKATELFERFTIQYPTHPRLQEARFDLAEAYFGKKEYITAANEYSRLADDYPAGPYADDARFKVCESYYQLAPKPQLDPQYTKVAIGHCESLLSYYSNSEFAERGRKIISELKTRLAEKTFLAGEFYFKRSAYDPAIVYYEAVLREYPDTETAPRALLRMYESYRIINYQEEMEAAKARLLKDYPNSPEAKRLQQTTTANP